LDQASIALFNIFPIPESLQKNYRSGVGMLLYLIKYSRPDISNAVRELSMCMDRATYGTLPRDALRYQIYFGHQKFLFKNSTKF
jgi:hypothetical protein